MGDEDAGTNDDRFTMYRYPMPPKWQQEGSSHQDLEPPAGFWDGTTPIASRAWIEHSGSIEMDRFLVLAHLIVVLPVLVVLLIQWVRPTKGDSLHKSLGKFVFYFAAPVTVVNGFALVADRVYAKPVSRLTVDFPPALLPKLIELTAIIALGFTCTLTAHNAVILRRILPLESCGTITMVLCVVNALYVLLVGYPAWVFHAFSPDITNYELSCFLNTMIIGFVLPWNDLSNAWRLWHWRQANWCISHQDWIDHHAMNVWFFTAISMAALLLFTSGDAHYVHQYPGPPFVYRIVYQLLPQAFFLLPWLRRWWGWMRNPVTDPDTRRRRA